MKKFRANSKTTQIFYISNFHPQNQKFVLDMIVIHLSLWLLQLLTYRVICVPMFHYIFSTGDVVLSSMQFQLTSELNATIPTFTLTCISTGGPATTVSWTSNNSAVTEDSAHSITSQVLTDAETATYNHTLTVTGRLVGEYECTVSNNKPSSSSRALAVVGENYKYTF